MTPDKPIKYWCVCGRGFTTRSGDANHGRVCPQERERSARYVVKIEAEHRANMAARLAQMQEPK